MILPTGYTKLEYIQSDGTQYVDTGIKVNKADAYKMMLIAHLTSNDNYAGCNGYMQFQANIGNGQKSEITINYANITEKIFVDGLQVSSTNWASYNGQDVKLGLFKMGDINDGWFSGSSQIGKLYSCQIYSSTVLIRNYIPCINPDGEAGLYDTVNSKFYGNAGTGVFFAGPQRVKLPNGYKQLEYIHLDGTQYIDMGFKATENTKIEAKFHNEQSANSAVFGADKAWTQDAFGIWINSTIAVPVVGTVSGTIGVSYSSVYDTFTLDKNTLKLNGGTIWTASGVSAFQTPTNVCLGAVNRNGAVSEKFVGRMYYCKAWESDTLIRNFVPCKNASGVIGLYDMVCRQFYANAGTGVFTAGPEVVWPSNDAIYVRINGVWKQIDGIKIL